MVYITALFYTAMQYQGLLITIPKLFDLFDLLLLEYIENVTQAISYLILEQFLEIIKDIQSTTFTIKVQNGIDSNKYIYGDIEF